MDRSTQGGAAKSNQGGTTEMSPAAKEKYRVLSARYGKDFYGISDTSCWKEVRMGGSS